MVEYSDECKQNMTKKDQTKRKKWEEKMRMNLRNYLVVFGGHALRVLASDQFLNKNILHKKNKNVPRQAKIAVDFHGHLNHSYETKKKSKRETIQIIKMSTIPRRNKKKAFI